MPAIERSSKFNKKGAPWLEEIMETTVSRSFSGVLRCRRTFRLGLEDRCHLVDHLEKNIGEVVRHVTSVRSEPRQVEELPEAGGYSLVCAQRIMASYAVFACTQKHLRISLPNSRSSRF